MKNSQEMLDHLAKFAKEIFMSRGEVVPMWVIEGSDDIMPMVTPFSGYPGEKDAVHEMVRAKAKEINAHVVGFIAEAWQVTRDTKKDALDVVPSECDDRVEVIQVMAEDHHGTKMGHYFIHREKDKTYLSSFEVTEGTPGGRFVGILEKFDA